ncbi:TVP38/TMEM64 family inner membrane protein YdjZ [Pirellulimonas nuda]|uniref:TVP38/TMEM64 family membrane protein n=1 Tax=Pirellulimonas nuda TaxID=2528009 RepID=A0A518D5M8_9BACT|nr:TVP38/TMEM64 family protein [Pirellulimonas nuda]QDU86769.1 TVP38/TMEM64 family inner membrane protein YdjZ [Pirellulimonas nuda]
MPTPTESTSALGAGGWLRVAAPAALMIGLTAAFALLPVGDYLKSLLAWVDALGPWGPAAFVALYVLATVLFVPGLVLTLGGGFLFGVVWGSLLVSLASVLGAVAALLVGRYAARDAVRGMAERFPKFAAIDKGVEQEGFKIVLLTRLSPLLPFNALNYLYGLTGVRLRDYTLASWLGMLPATVLYVYFGSLAGDLARVASGEGIGGPWKWALLAVGLAATVTVTVVVTRMAGRALRERVDSSDE